jgi:hypothetical protein
LYLSKGQRPEYIHVQEGENVQITPWRNIIIKKANTYLIHLNVDVNIHVNSHVSNVYDIYFCHRNWAWLGLVGSKLFYDGAEMSHIASIYDVFVKSSRELTCDCNI